MNKISTLSRGEMVLFDDDCLATVAADLFAPKSDGAAANVLGRGSVYFFEHQGLNLVLRHYRRGGFVRHFIRDNYLFSGIENTRMWREYHLLQKLASFNLPVPKAVAVRCVKTTAFSYRGDLITQSIPSSETLAQVLSRSSLSDDQWRTLGAFLALFHCRGVFHADLNANNILLDSGGRFYLIDFDRCGLRSVSNASSWQKSNLDRLLRSFLKLKGKDQHFRFDSSKWTELLGSYVKAGGKGA